jgi:hypothetical protein
MTLTTEFLIIIDTIYESPGLLIDELYETINKKHGDNERLAFLLAGKTKGIKDRIAELHCIENRCGEYYFVDRKPYANNPKDYLLNMLVEGYLIKKRSK